MHAIFIGLSGFPLGTASIQRQKLLAKSLISEGWKVTVICTRSMHSGNSNVKRVGRSDNIMYIYIYPPEKKESFIVRNLQKLFTPFFEFLLLIKLKSKYGISAGIVSNRNDFFASIKYFIASKILNFKLFINLVEVYKDREGRPLYQKINDYFFNRYGLSFYKAYLPISREIIKTFSSLNKSYFYIPVIVDMNSVTGVETITTNGKFFLYCGAAGYPNHINFLLESFKLLNEIECKFILVTYGAQEEIKKVLESIEKLQLKDKVIVKMNLSYHDLYSLYKSAAGLLLPLFDTIQDRARFPHKLAEYLASGNVVLSNPVGEIVHYLSDKKNVLFSPPDKVECFLNNLKWVLDNPIKSKEIGENGQKVCSNFFDYHKIAPNLNKFLLSA